MHGIGNDFVMVDADEAALFAGREDEVARLTCDRKFGIGGDGLILVLPGESAPLRMRMFNPDGSEPEMCGNGIRCFVKYVFDRGKMSGNQVDVETGAGTLSLTVEADGGVAQRVRVDMGPARLSRHEIPMAGDTNDPQVVGEQLFAGGEEFKITAVSMGNPHAVFFVGDVNAFDLNRFGPLLETHPTFPRKTNVHAVQIISRNEIRMRTWERGAGITLACGTGACGCGVASILNGHTERSMLVHLPGGDLEIEWLKNGHVLMTGPATEVFSGEFPL